MLPPSHARARDRSGGSGRGRDLLLLTVVLRTAWSDRVLLEPLQLDVLWGLHLLGNAPAGGGGGYTLMYVRPLCII